MAKKGLRGTLEKRLMAYSAAAAGVLALAPSAEATIHYSGVKSLAVPQTISLDGVTPAVRFIYNSTPWNDVVKLGGPYGGEFIKSTAHGWVKKFAANDSITAGRTWTGGGYKFLNGVTGYTSKAVGNFNGATGYIGVRFHTANCTAGAGKWNYGWINYTGVRNYGSGTITDWAYEDQCDTAIKAGTKSSPPLSIPTLNQWGMIVLTLLLGGIATRMLRKQEEEI